MSSAAEEKTLTTADLAAAAEAPVQRDARAEPPRTDAAPVRDEGAAAPRREDEQLEALFMPEIAQDFRSRWDAVQIGFVDDPQQAVRQADELVAQVIKSLAETFSNERARLEGELTQGERASTENLRVALRRYRSFFQRLLSL